MFSQLQPLHGTEWPIMCCCAIKKLLTFCISSDSCYLSHVPIFGFFVAKCTRLGVDQRFGWVRGSSLQLMFITYFATEKSVIWVRHWELTMNCWEYSLAAVRWFQSPSFAKDEAPRMVNHFQFNCWTKTGSVPTSTVPLMALLDLVEEAQHGTGHHSVVVHCQYAMRTCYFSPHCAVKAAP